MARNTSAPKKRRAVAFGTSRSRKEEGGSRGGGAGQHQHSDDHPEGAASAVELPFQGGQTVFNS